MNRKSTRKLRTTTKQDLRPDLNPFDHALWGVLETITNSTSHAKIGSLKTAIEAMQIISKTLETVI